MTAFTLYAEAEKPGAPSVEDSFLVVVGDTGLALLSAAWGSRILMEVQSVVAVVWDVLPAHVLALLCRRRFLSQSC